MRKKKKVDTKNVVLPHSKAKIDFFKSYLEKYLPILVNSDKISEIHIVDAFCGKGEYEDGAIGSPIEAYNAIKQVVSSSLFFQKPTKIHHIINDISIENIKSVENYINSQGGVKGWIYSSYNLDFEHFKSYLSNLVNNQGPTSRTLIFLDPYGYKNIDKTTLIELTKNKKTEIVLWLPIANMKRFIDKSKNSDETAFLPLKYFLDAFFPNQLDEVYSKMDVFEFINKIKNELKVNDLYGTSYYIERDSANYYALFFLSPNNLGYEKILEVKWKLDETYGRGYNQLKPTGLFDVEFKEQDKRANEEFLKAELRQFFSVERTNIEIRQFVLQLEFLPKHVMPILKYWHEKKLIKAVDTMGNPLTKLTAASLDHGHFKNKTVTFTTKLIK